MIEKGKQYRTQDGREVRILATDVVGPFPVLALVKCANGKEDVLFLRLDGRRWPDENSHCDLIEVMPRIKGWVNVYRRCGRMVYIGHESQEKATKRAGVDRIACLPIDGEEGEGL